MTGDSVVSIYFRYDFEQTVAGRGLFVAGIPQTLSLYIYIYIGIVKLITGPRLGALKFKTGPSSKLKTDPSLFSNVFPILNSVFWVCSKTQIVSLCAQIVFSQNCLDVKVRFSNRKLHFLFLFYVGDRETGKK